MVGESVLGGASRTRPPLEFDAEFLRRIEVLNLVARKILQGSHRADRRSIRKGSSAEFADHRTYVPGDDTRHVDWHLFGRLDELFLKLYEEEENLHLTLLVDLSSSMDGGQHHKLNFGLQVAASLAYIGMSNMDACNVLPFGTRLKDGLWRMKGRSSIFKTFEFLKGLQPEGRTDLKAAFQEFVGRERRRGIVIVVSDFMDQTGFQAALKSLRHPRHDIFAIHVVDPEEEDPALRGDLRLIDQESGDHREINVTDGLLVRYREAFEALAGRIESFCIKNEMGYVRARTHVEFDELVLRILRRGGLLA